ncbi:aminotransferase class III-fold pyridoxal phosphate-dependent enzyme [uncultured Aquincola sp.]|uniref:aminotransferase class III-fold pyridoxal phosphate-dependent enzyme n=1 Tax=uncultured Aquincola sp. TaxID=886556 RepID=UPI0032B2C03B
MTDRTASLAGADGGVLPAAAAPGLQESLQQLSARFSGLAPGARAWRSSFHGSGAQAMESALRLARAHSGRPAIIKLSSGCLPGATPAWTEFGRPAGPVWRLPAPTPLHGDTAEHTLGRLDELLAGPLRPHRVAALVIEPLQAEGSVQLLDADLLAELRRRCDWHHIQLVADETRCGLARTGRLRAMDHHTVQADLVVHAQGPDAPLPLAVVTGRAELMQAAPDEGPWPEGPSLLARAQAVRAQHAVLDAIERQRLCERAEQRGRQLVAVLVRAMACQPRIADIRGLGSVLAVECLDGSLPDPAFARRVQARAAQHGLQLPVSGEAANVLRFPYSLAIDDRAFDALCTAAELALRGA